MWVNRPSAFAAKYGVTEAQAWQFRCTGEHLVARQDGGDDSDVNVVAACHYCNQRRHLHRPENAPPPEIYKRRVQNLMRKGTWFGAQVLTRALD
jgi:hypothetical protein